MKTVGILIILILSSIFIQAAYLRDVHQEIQQPDGTVISCFVSGDEFYHWLHDENGYVIVRDKFGFLVYADKVDGRLVPTGFTVGRYDPEREGLEPGLMPDPEQIEAERLLLQTGAEPRAPKTGTINNIVIFIRFSDQTEYAAAKTLYDGYFNTNTSSMKSYFLEASYNALAISSTFYPIPPGSTVTSFQDSHARNYFSPYNASTNPGGYQTETERTNREHTLLKDAVNGVSSQIPVGLNVDGDGDGDVDNVCFVIRGASDNWGNLLWPHRWSLYSQTVYINSKQVWDYNFQLETGLDVGVLCHEMFHSLGSPDLYHYSSCSSNTGIKPVGPWDLMEWNSTPPEHMGAFMKYRYGTWISSIPVITTAGTYTLNPITSSTGNAYRINSPFSSTEYFIVEYRRKTGTFENSVPASGLLAYRIDSTQDGLGNRCGPPDEVYIYRPDGTTSSSGDVYTANFSSDVIRTQINDTTNPSSFLQNGSAGGLNIYNITTAGATISFTVGLCTVGVTPANRYLYAAGGTHNLTVTAGSSCAWTATKDQTWIVINSGGSGTGNGTINYTVSANATTSPRTGHITVEGTVHTIYQAGTAGLPGTIPGSSSQGLKVTKAASQATSFSLDDGWAESAWGYGGNTKICWIQRFTPSIYPVQITRVDMLTWNSSVAVGRPVRLLVYLDPNGTGSPNSASTTTAYSQDTTVQVVSSTAWNQYTLSSPVTVNSGDFYVGFYDYNDSDGVNTYIAAFDTSAPNSRGYYKANSSAPGGFTDFASNGDFMLRASGTAYPNIKLSWGLPCNNATVPGQQYAVYGKALSQLAIEGYKPTPMDCALSLQEKYLNVTDNYYFTVVPLKSPFEGGHGVGRSPSNTCLGVLPDQSCP